MPEEDRTGRAELDERAEDDIDEGEDGQQEDAGGKEVEGALDDAVAQQRERLVVQAEDGRAVHEVERHCVPLIVEGIGNVIVAYDFVCACLHHFVYQVILRRWQKAEDLVQLVFIDI